MAKTEVMMKRSMSFILILSLSLSSIHSAFAEESFGSWWKNHGGKVVAGLLAAGAVITAGLAVAHGVSVQKKLEKYKSNPNYGKIVAVVGLLGPAGESKTFWGLNKLVDKGAISASEACQFIKNYGKPLAEYWNVNSWTSGIRGCGLPVLKKAQSEVQRVANAAGEALDEVAYLAEEAYGRAMSGLKGLFGNIKRAR